MIEAGRPLDIGKYFLICPDALGSTQTGFELHAAAGSEHNPRDLQRSSPGHRLTDIQRAQARAERLRAVNPPEDEKPHDG